MNVFVEITNNTAVEEGKIEIVERKGLGHPDYIADSLAENFSRKLCKYYIENFGTILHHNVDKLEIVGGKVNVKFGGGNFEKPVTIFFSGRATTEVTEGGKIRKIPVKKIAKESAIEFIKKNYRFFDPEDKKQIKYIVETKSGSADLVNVFKRKGEIDEGEILANDTSIGVGYAPLTLTERIVKELEKFINSKKFKEKHPYSGEDVKIMGKRIDKNLEITIAMGIVSKYVNNEYEYWSYKEIMMEEIREWIENKISNSGIKLNENGIDLGYNGNKGLYLNTGDRKTGEKEKGNLYLTLTGISAEQGDDGAVGRGNRVHGVIPFQRPMSMEAVAGKNPVNHIGKLYNVLAFKIANKIYDELKDEIKQVDVKLLSQIGTPITNPHIAYAGVILRNYNMRNEEKINNKIKEIFESELTKEKFINLRDDFVEGKIEVC